MSDGSSTRLRPLPLPAHWQRRIQKIPALSHLGIALMINILSLALPVMMLQIYDRIIPHQSFGTLAVLIAGVCIALAVDAALRVMRAWLVGWSAASHEHAASCAAMERLSQADVGTFEKTPAGEHLQNLAALGRLREFNSGQSLTALVDLPFAVIFLALIYYLGGILVLVPVILLLLFCLSAGVAGARLRTALDHRRKADDNKSSLMVSILSGIHTAKSMAMEAPLLRRFEAAQDEVTRDSYRVALASGLAASLSAAFGQLSLILTAAAGAFLVLHGYLSIGGLSACTFLAGRAIQPIQRVLGTWLRLQDLAIARRQAQAVFSLPVQARTNARPTQTPQGRVTLEDVSFAYDGASPLLKNISLRIEPGEAIAISGDRAGGKSALLQVIAGVLTAQKGSVRVDGVNPAEYGLSALQGRIGYMPQHGTIFRGTIMENLTGFRPGEDNAARAREAAEELGLDSVIDVLPRGYQTLLTDTAADPVPPGVKQRIALARVLAARPAVLLFDDADQALDKEGYNRLFRLMGRLKSTTTLVMVSHDQNLLSFADRHYRLENGMLVLERDMQGGIAL